MTSGSPSSPGACPKRVSRVAPFRAVSPLPPNRRQNAALGQCRRSASKGHGHYVFIFASGAATSMAVSTKRRASGLSGRLFSVAIPIGTLSMGASTGKILISGRALGNFRAEVMQIVRKRPLPSRLNRVSVTKLKTAVRGGGRPLEPKRRMAIAPRVPSCGGDNAQGSLSNSASFIFLRLAHGLCTPATTTCPSS